MSGTFPLVFSVTSGKGGVGKTNLSVNLALCLAQLNKRVALIDADLGLANVDVLLGLTPQKNLFHLFHEGASLREILFPTPYGFSTSARLLGRERNAHPVHRPEAGTAGSRGRAGG